MKKFFVMMVTALAVMQAYAAPVDQMSAQRVAQAFLQNHSSKVMAASKGTPILHRAVVGNVKIQQPVFYVFNTDNTFVIVSGEDRGEQILGYGQGPIDLDKIPANMKAWLNMYKEQIEYLQSHPGLVVESNSKITAPNRAASVAPMLTAQWDQGYPYYNQCVINGTQCVTGCPATSLAQVFYYWKYPQDPTPAVPAYTFKVTNDYGYVTGTQFVAGLPSTTFNWSNMKDRYTYSTSAQKAAVATLMRYIGQAEHMCYGSDGSGISSDSTVLIANACRFFGYDSGVRAIKKTNAYGNTIYSDSQWASMIQNELTNGCPIVYCAISNGGGHAFNVDGYDSSANTYHINWGWSGYGDAYFALNAFKDVDGYVFNQYQQMLTGLYPPGAMGPKPVLSVNPTSLTFSTKPGEPVTQTFTISGTDLTGNVTLSVSGHESFSVTPATLTAAQVAAGATVTVTYNPTAQGTHTATITASSLRADDVTVALTGTSVDVSNPEIVVSTNSLSFNTTVGNPVTQTFTLTGVRLSGNVSLSIADDIDHCFSLDKYTILRSAAVNGVEVTVTYDPYPDGEHTATINITSSGVDPVAIALNGVAGIAKFTPVMQPADPSKITETSFRADWLDESPNDGIDYYTLEVNAANGATFRATETGDANNRVITDFYTTYYVVNNLTAGGTFRYRVKATYIDGTESAWSNIEQVTLLQPAQSHIPGDVNHDGNVNISDVTSLIDYLLASGGDVCLTCADVNGDGAINISDVTSLIDILLS